MPSPLHLVPPEILSTIALSLAAARPFRPPLDLCSLRATCRHLRDALNSHYNPAVWSAAFDSRFDSAAVRRRNFRPNGRDYYDQLRQYADALDVLRSGNLSHPDIGDILRIIYVMLLDNNGKNRAQLEAAGVDSFVDAYVRTRLWSEAPLHDGWPDGGSASSFALWIKWMLTTPAQLQSEPVPVREEMVALVLPFVLNPYRYAQAEAPPSHFLLPLYVHHGIPVVPHSFPSAHGPYPVYVPSQEVSYPYFGSLPSFSPPPISIAAKLLYFARREILPLNIPPHLPRTRAEAPPSNHPEPTQEDFIEFNAHKGAQPPTRVTWDWDLDTRLLNGVPDSSSSSSDLSSIWDSDYWRRRLCGNVWKRQPKWRPAKVYIPGSMDGLWQGRLVFPMEEALRQLVQQAVYPPSNFNEMGLRVINQPVYMRLTEHHSVFPQEHVPFPPPPPKSEENDDESEWQDLSMRNAWFPGLPGSVNFEKEASAAMMMRMAGGSGSGSGFSYASSEYGNRNRNREEEEEEEKTLVTIEGQGSDSWVYTNFNRKRKHRHLEEDHAGHDNCDMCFERERLYRKAVKLDMEDLEMINEVYSNEWEDIERMFGSVGLARGESEEVVMDDDDDDDDDDEDDEDDDEEYDDEDVDMEDENEDDDGDIEFIEDPNAEIRNQKQSSSSSMSSPSKSKSKSSFIPPVRRGTDRAKIEKCDGIRDIIFSGSTDKRHAQAWNHFTFYGRIRPWDGLIGILRRAYWPRHSLLFFYGYLVGSENFVGNWRFAAADPNSPTWESAFVMSRRKDEDDKKDG